MAEAFAEMQSQDGTANLTHAEWLGLLIHCLAGEWNTRREGTEKAVTERPNALKAACVQQNCAMLVHRRKTWITKHGAASTKRSTIVLGPMADKVSLQQMLTGRWIKDRRNLMITGPCGVGKTWLACALAQAACRDGTTVLYKRMPRPFDELELAHDDGRFPRLFKALTKTQLLILDNWGPDRLDASQRRDLMKIVEDRYEVGSTLITSQLPIDAWHDVIGEPTFADAILDRLVHNAYRAEPDGQSMRKTKLKTGDESTQN